MRRQSVNRKMGTNWMFDGTPVEASDEYGEDGPLVYSTFVTAEEELVDEYDQDEDEYDQWYLDSLS